jgi:hypothetical protein
MEVDTVTVRGVAGELNMIALAWLGSPMSSQLIENQPGAFGVSPLGVELSAAMVTFARRGQEALRDLALRVNATGEALLLAAGEFEKTEAALAMDPA